MTKREQINFRLDPELNQVLEYTCNELGVTKTEFAKRALKTALGIPVNHLPAKPVLGVVTEALDRISALEQRLERIEITLSDFL
jgi:hypothetical protein